MNFFATLPYVYSLGPAILMLLFDGLVMLGLTFYLDLVLPTDDSPKLSPFFFVKVNISKSKQRLVVFTKTKAESKNLSKQKLFE